MERLQVIESCGWVGVEALDDESSGLRLDLRRTGLPYKVLPVSAKEIIEEIKSLSSDEQAQVIAFVNEIKAKPEILYADDKTFREAVDRVFKQHHELLRRLAS
jgi:hypothetical protein